MPSQLVPAGVGAQDSALGANTVALPLNPSSALFHNPAQLTQLPSSVTVGMLGIPFERRYTHPLGYDETTEELPIAPSFGYVSDRWNPVHVGIGMYGSLGFRYNFKADPAHGVPNNLFNELTVVSLAPSLAYSLSPKFHIGVAINPSYGRLRVKRPSPVGRIDLDVRGPGIFGTIGFLYTPTSRLSLGVGYKTPGTIFMFGNARVAGRGDNATVDFQIPQILEFGVAYHVTDRLTFVAQGRWAEFSVFENTHFDFEHRDFLDSNAVADARDRLRIGGGVQYKLLPELTIGMGFSWERWAIASSSLSPLLPDNTDHLFGFGLGWQHGLWRADLMGGLSYTETRRISATRNSFFHGRYSLDLSLFGVQLTRQFELGR